MTANNVLVTDEGVVLFSDTSVYTPEGVITGFASKSYLNEKKRWGALFTGSFAAAKFWRREFQEIDVSFDEAVNILPRELWDVHGHLPDVFDELGHVGLVLAGYSDKAGDWRMAKITTCTHSGREPYVMSTDESGLLRPPLTPQCERPLSDAELEVNLQAFGVDEFARRVLSAQRRVHQMEVGAGERNCAVGGEGELIIITAKGVQRRTIAKWFDVVGEDRENREARVAREPAPTFIRLSRAERRRMGRGERRAA